MTEGTTNGVSPERLVKLLAMGLQDCSGKGNPEDTETPAEVLQDILDSRLPLDPTLPNSLPTILNWTSDEVLSASGRSIRDLLLDPKTHLDVIATLKDYGKGLARRAGTADKETAVTVIYYAAIANALVFHGRKITRHPYEILQEAYAELGRKTWIPPELKNLFAEAQAFCRQREKIPG